MPTNFKSKKKLRDVCSIIYSIETRAQSQHLYFQILFRCNSVIIIFKKNFFQLFDTCEQN